MNKLTAYEPLKRAEFRRGASLSEVQGNGFSFSWTSLGLCVSVMFLLCQMGGLVNVMTVAFEVPRQSQPEFDKAVKISKTLTS